MAKTLEQIIGYENLTGLIQNQRGGVPDDLLPPALMSTTRQVAGKTATWFQTQNSRQTPRLSDYGAPSRRREKQQAQRRSAVCLHFHEHETHDASVLQQITNFDNPSRQAKGQAEIDRQTAEFRRIINNGRMSAIYSVFARGKIDYDSDGNLIASGTATTSADMSPNSTTNQGSGQDEDGDALVSATWATDGTDIIGDVKRIKRTSRQRTGFPIRHCLYGSNIPDYIATNTALKNLINGSPALSTQMANGTEVPNGLLGLNWWSVDEAFFEDNDGTNQSWFGDDSIIFLPEPNRDWYEIVEGSYPVPTNLGSVSGDAGAATGDFEEVNGMFSHAKVTDDPVGIKHFMGDTYLPILKVPDAVYILDATP